MRVFHESDLLASEPVTVGAGGTGGSSGGTNGGAGGSSTFHGMNGTGGTGGESQAGSNSAVSAAGSGGSGTGTLDMSAFGDDGQPGRTLGTGSGDPGRSIPGQGGGSFYGGASKTSGANSGGTGLPGQGVRWRRLGRVQLRQSGVPCRSRRESRRRRGHRLHPDVGHVTT